MFVIRIFDDFFKNVNYELDYIHIMEETIETRSRCLNYNFIFQLIIFESGIKIVEYGRLFDLDFRTSIIHTDVHRVSVCFVS